MRKIVMLVMMTVLVVPAGAANAAEPEKPAKAIFGPEALRDAVRQTSMPAPQTPAPSAAKADSVVNGVVVGAVAGAVAFPTYWLWRTNGSDDYRGVWLKLTLPGALIGGLAGAIVDGLR